MTFEQELKALIAKHRKQQEMDALLNGYDKEKAPEYILVQDVEDCLQGKYPHQDCYYNKGCGCGNIRFDVDPIVLPLNRSRIFEPATKL